ncbi:dihydropyrimidine dehydrogenase subunit A [Fulvitalea axinellae]|uniref:Dihydropyrimidine dehydrogenase subunit A n=1 Tax=Fulvitalea axinellae TaxID=1182444 RepID=A0AAU9D4F3_9BACT|nr:dihydropyrimidine dehydrogenase subunit A [Fulvitalea axinellae]
MGKPTGFLEFDRQLPGKVDPLTRVQNYKEFYLEFSDENINNQAARCMDCGVPFCHSGCPLGNIIPEFNEAVYQKNWEEAAEILLSTNNFPEFTGRICPAPCESACVLGINQPPVTIENIEKTIIEKAFSNGLVTPQPPKSRTGKKVAVVGSGPAGLAAAAQLNKAGHSVTVFERDDRVGGLLRYGIPDFKLGKWVIDRRTKVMEEEGIVFKTSVNVGVDFTVEQLHDEFDAVALCGGSTIPRDLPIPGREAEGIHFAMDFLKQQNKKVAGDDVPDQIRATEKHVIVIGGGDTGADCVGTSNRHGATTITQLELMPKPPAQRAESTPWPMWPMMLRTSTSHEEGCDRKWAVLTKEFTKGENGEVTGLKIAEVRWDTPKDGGRPTFVEVEGTEKVLKCDLALLAIGFVHPQKEGLVEDLGVSLDGRGNVATATSSYQTDVPGVFAAGDMRRGQSLVVWAMSEGRECAKEMDEYLTGKESVLEQKNESVIAV